MYIYIQIDRQIYIYILYYVIYYIILYILYYVYVIKTQSNLSKYLWLFSSNFHMLSFSSIFSLLSEISVTLLKSPSLSCFLLSAFLIFFYHQQILTYLNQSNLACCYLFGFTKTRKYASHISKCFLNDDKYFEYLEYFDFQVGGP